jgi:hypothetical protein
LNSANKIVYKNSNTGYIPEEMYSKETSIKPHLTTPILLSKRRESGKFYKKINKHKA